MENTIQWWRISFEKEEIEKIRESILNEHINQGPVTEELEKKISEYFNIPYVILTTSGSTALLMSMIALDIGQGDEVIIPNRTWIATAHAPLLRNAKVTLVDVLKEKPLLDVSKIEEKINSKTKAIIPVHLNGRSVNMKELNKIAKKHNLYVIEDACQAMFSKNSDGFLGVQSDIGCFSLGLTKLVSTGQGGVIVTCNKDIYERLKLIRNHGTISIINPIYTLVGSNFKFTDIQASIGLVQMSKINEKISHVKKVYSMYVEELKSLSYIEPIPVDVSNGELPLYTEVLCDNRPKLMDFLKSYNIIPRPSLPSLDSASYLKNSEEFPNSRKFAEFGVFLPCGPNQPLKNIDIVLKALKEFENRK